MKPDLQNGRFVLRTAPPGAVADDLARAVGVGMASTPKRIPCRFFYDETGSRLFEEICEQPEYYPTRAEDEILSTRAGEIAEAAPEGCDLVELGSGDARKTRHLLGELLARRGSLRYVPIDISETALTSSSEQLLAVHPGLSIVAIAAEYEQGLGILREESPGAKLVLWLGSNVGNFDRAAAAAFLGRLATRFSREDRLLLGVDLRKDPEVLEEAYDDARGVTARFNLNVLARLNAELGADFDLDRFRHVVRVDDAAGRVEMHLESLADQTVTIEALGLAVPIARGERIHTEDSYKYSRDEITALARAAGMEVRRTWLDSEGRFSLSLLAPGR